MNWRNSFLIYNKTYSDRTQLDLSDETIRKWKFWNLMVPSERSSWVLSEYALLYIKKLFLQFKKSIFRCKMKFFRFFYAVFFILLPKFTDFINSDDCIGKFTSNLSGYIQFLFKKIFEFNKKMNISCENMRNSDNYDYAYSFFAKDFWPRPLYWYI